MIMKKKKPHLKLVDNDCISVNKSQKISDNLHFYDKTTLVQCRIQNAMWSDCPKIRVLNE